MGTIINNKNKSEDVIDKNNIDISNLPEDIICHIKTFFSDFYMNLLKGERSFKHKVITNETISDLKMKNFVISFGFMKNINLDKITFLSYKFINSSFRDCVFTDCIFIDGEINSFFTNCKFIRCKFYSSIFLNFIVDSSEIINCVFVENNFTKVSWFKTSFDKNKFTRCFFKLNKFLDSVIETCYFKKCNFTNESIPIASSESTAFSIFCIFSYNKYIDCNFDILKYHMTTFEYERTESSSLKRIYIDNCTINNIAYRYCLFDNFNILTCNISYSHFKMCDLYDSKINNSTLNSLELSDCVLKNFFMEGNIKEYVKFIRNREIDI